MRLHTFILLQQDSILAEWDAFATSLHRVSGQMTKEAIRDHAREILDAVAADIAQDQSTEAQHQKSIGKAPVIIGAANTAAQTHAILRQKSGFDINELVSEYRALRACVLRLWAAEVAPAPIGLQDTIRFNEAIDQAIAESVSLFTFELERSRNLLLGMLGHDMRNPLGVILATAEHLQRINAGEVVSKAAGRLISSGARLHALLDDLVDFNRSNLGLGIRVTPQACDLGRLSEEQVELLRSAYPGRQIALEQCGELQGSWDPERLHQLLGNLVTNALKHGDRAAPVQVRVDGSAEQVLLEVSNQGQPIPQEYLDDIFEPLRRVPHADSDDITSDGLGLGLYIVSEVTHAHRGEVSVTSTEHGTVFRVVLPRAST